MFESRRKAHARRSPSRFRPAVDSLEGRALLSRGVTAMVATPAAVVTAAATPTTTEANAIVTDLYQRLLHRAPESTAVVDYWSNLLTTGKAGRGLIALSMLVGTEYTTDYPTNETFVRSLYANVLDQANPPTSHVNFWVAKMASGDQTRCMVAYTFLRAPGSFLYTALAVPPTAQGSVTNATVTGVTGTTAFSGNTAQAGAVFNSGDIGKSAQITVTVSDAGTYVLDQSTSFNIVNNTGKAWSGYAISILPSSTADASLTQAVDTTGQFARLDISSSDLSFYGGSVPGNNTSFKPRITFVAKKAGTIVFQETPTVATTA